MAKVKEARQSEQARRVAQEWLQYIDAVAKVIAGGKAYDDRDRAQVAASIRVRAMYTLGLPPESYADVFASSRTDANRARKATAVRNKAVPGMVWLMDAWATVDTAEAQAIYLGVSDAWRRAMECGAVQLTPEHEQAIEDGLNVMKAMQALAEAGGQVLGT